MYVAMAQSREEHPDECIYQALNPSKAIVWDMM
jgi:hypothetical protein